MNMGQTTQHSDLAPSARKPEESISFKNWEIAFLTCNLRNIRSNLYCGEAEVWPCSGRRKGPHRRRRHGKKRKAYKCNCGVDLSNQGGLEDRRSGAKLAKEFEE